MKSALKKSVVSTSISLILASGMAAFAAHAADDVKLKATKTNVAFSDFTPTEYSTKGKPNIIVLKWHTEFGHLNRGDMLTSEQHRCSNEKKKFQRRV
ncbi:sulfatase [Escherichia coli]|nr:sulfatase [Escherichia coli]